MTPDPHHDPQGLAPLDNCALYRNGDIDQVRRGLEMSFGPHRLEIIGAGGFTARHHRAPGQRISLNFIELGTRVMLSMGRPETFFLALFPITGGASVSTGSKTVYCHAKKVCIIGSHQDSTMIWGKKCRLIMVRIEKTALLDYLSLSVGARVEEPLVFKGGPEIDTAAGARLARLVRHLVSQVEADAEFLRRAGAMARHLEDALLAGICEGHLGDIAAVSRQIIPGKIRRAEIYMLNHIDRRLTLGKIAEATNVGQRSLQVGFRRYHEMSPMQYLRTRRLQRIHEELSKGIPGETVTNVAERWGISHLGRFSRSYRDLYGCAPSDTLHNARDRGFMT